MVPSWITVLTSLGAGAVVGSLLTSLVQLWINKQAHKNQLEREKITFERDTSKEKAVYEREQLGIKKERVRQAGKVILQAAQNILDIVTDALQLFEEDVRINGLLVKVTLEGTVVEGFQQSETAPEYKRLASELRKELTNFDDGIEALRLEVPDNEIFADLSSDVISSFRQLVRYSLMRIEKDFTPIMPSEGVLKEIQERRTRILSRLGRLQKSLPELLAQL